RGEKTKREKARTALSALPKSVRQEGLQLAMMDSSSTVRKFAAGELQAGSGLEAARYLTRAALSDPVRDVRKIALASLKEGSFPDAQAFLIGGLTSKKFPVRLNALHALGDFPSKETVEALCTVMESSVSYGGSPRVNIFSGRQFGYIRDFDVEVAAFTEIGDPIVATGMEGIVLDVRVLYAQERQAGVQGRAARRSLYRISGKDFGNNVEVWRKWAKEKFGS
ncbi:MAG: HEAT repeat domain-containing protein, partial [Planctomycetota bacterium]